MNKQTKRRRKTKNNRRRKTKNNRRNTKNNTRNNKTNRRRNRYKRNLTEFIPENQGKGVSLFSIPEKQPPFKIIVDNNHNKQFGNIIPGLREM